MALESPVLLRLPRGLAPTEFVLLHISPHGDRPLDLKLIGTENETIFKVILPEEEHKAITQGVEAAAKVESGGNKLSITIQRRIEGITQRLGSLILRETEDEAPDLFEWCGEAVESKSKSTTKLQTLESSLKYKDEQFKKLEESFAELVDLKNGHEKSLLEKFSLLLNEKKLKIRDQQRLLASSNVDPAKLEALEAARRDSRSRSAGPSRKGKRKADETIEEDESDDGFEKMDVDPEPPQDSEDENQRQRTPDAESTADETESDGEEARPPSPPARKTAVKHSSPPVAAPVLDGSETESDDDEL
ncbi:hypothetical protein LCER1_G007597 [Lachnellula cervina]|uniref:DNA repair protein XRCC4 n=1 Tax=Lachnellula cervina TaxID=1316786 RepID=A0A7D8YSL2_9HELO|nr:hypothetical protein LCER1_G007597 [Lachnellula cervina]